MANFEIEEELPQCLSIEVSKAQRRKRIIGQNIQQRKTRRNRIQINPAEIFFSSSRRM